MPFIFLYLLKLSICLVLVWLFYQLVLRRLTFYNWNRWYLLTYTLLSFFIPLINITSVVEKNEWTNIIPAIEKFTASPAMPDVVNPGIVSNPWNWALLLLSAGTAIMLTRLCIQLLSLRKLFSKARLLSEEEIKVYQVNKNIIPFSFGNAIFLNQHLHAGEELKEIIRHEFVHVRQKHTLDIIWSELLCIFNWYNPFAWLIRKSIRQNLEFAADNKVLQNGINKKQYQYLLLKIIGNNHFSIASPFNFSSLKKRIAMMNKMKTARMQIVKFLFIVPLVAVLLVAFRNNHDDRSAIKKRQQENFFPKDTIPDNKKKIAIEKYDLKKKEERSVFESKYGKITSTNVNTSVDLGTVATVSSTSGKTVVIPVQVTSANTNVSTVTHVSGQTVIAPIATTNAEAVTIANNYNYNIAGKEDILVTITKYTSRQQLDEFKKQMKEKEIELNYEDIDYNDKGILTHISGTMQSKNANSNFSATGFEKLILSMIRNNENIYFKVRISDKKEVSLNNISVKTELLFCIRS